MEAMEMCYSPIFQQSSTACCKPPTWHALKRLGLDFGIAKWTHGVSTGGSSEVIPSGQAADSVSMEEVQVPGPIRAFCGGPSWTGGVDFVL